MSSLRMLFACLGLLLASLAAAIGGTAGPYQFTFTTDPAVVPVGKANVMLHIDQGGKPVDGATVKFIAKMPGMDMGEREQIAQPKAGEPGTYSTTGVFAMAGSYEAKLSINGPAGHGNTTFTVQTGQSTELAAGGFPTAQVLIGLLAIAAALWLVARMRKFGMRAETKVLTSRGTIGPILLVVAILAISVWAVNNLRRKGAMTPLEAQVMEMNAPPPPGTALVTLAKAKGGTIQSTVSYSGQAVGYNEEDIFARVTGALVYMPLYVGDKIHKGQVVARLDTSETGPNAAEKAAGVDVARQGVGVAESDYRQSKTQIDLAVAERKQYEAAVASANADLDAAQADKSAAQAALAAATADVGDAEARSTSADADLAYWTEEFKRASNLIQGGVISTDEFQKEKTEYEKSKASVRQAKLAVDSANARVKAAEAGVRKGDAAIVASKHRIEASKQELATRRASIAGAVAAASSSRQKVTQAQSGVRQAQAALGGAAAQRGFATITSPIDGVVTQRLLSPGTLVQPGQSILKVAQVSPMRLQANVPTTDLAKIRVGAMVMAIPTSGDAVMAKVSSIQPSIDPGARTGVVEAIVSNADGRFVTGQYVQLEISVGLAGHGIIVPNVAIRSGTSQETYVWVAEQAAGGTTVRMVKVITGDSDGNNTVVLTGLSDGQQVVTSGFVNLQEGAAVSDGGMKTQEVATETDGPTIHVTSAGFVPSTVVLAANGPTTLTFIRDTDNTCAKEIVFAELGIKKDLPLNKPVRIDVGHPSKKRLAFACGMDMVKGVLVIR